eukprot:405540-Hanusia_phi.AAC.10
MLSSWSFCGRPWHERGGYERKGCRKRETDEEEASSRTPAETLGSATHRPCHESSRLEEKERAVVPLQEAVHGPECERRDGAAGRDLELDLHGRHQQPPPPQLQVHHLQHRDARWVHLPDGAERLQQLPDARVAERLRRPAAHQGPPAQHQQVCSSSDAELAAVYARQPVGKEAEAEASSCHLDRQVEEVDHSLLVLHEAAPLKPPVPVWPREDPRDWKQLYVDPVDPVPHRVPVGIRHLQARLGEQQRSLLAPSWLDPDPELLRPSRGDVEEGGGLGVEDGVEAEGERISLSCLEDGERTERRCPARVASSCRLAHQRPVDSSVGRDVGGDQNVLLLHVVPSQIRQLGHRHRSQGVAAGDGGGLYEDGDEARGADDDRERPALDRREVKRHRDVHLDLDQVPSRVLHVNNGLRLQYLSSPPPCWRQEALELDRRPGKEREVDEVGGKIAVDVLEEEEVVARAGSDRDVSEAAVILNDQVLGSKGRVLSAEEEEELESGDDEVAVARVVIDLLRRLQIQGKLSSSRELCDVETMEDGLGSEATEQRSWQR